MTSIARARLRRPGMLLRLAAVSLCCAVFVGGSGASATPIRQQIKDAKRDLIAFEEDLGRLVASFEGLERDLDRAGEEIESLRALLRRSDRAESVYERALADLIVRPLVSRELEDARARKEVIEAVLPGLRNQIWEQTLERKDKIEALDSAIELLEASQSGELVTKAGVGGGRLITYSADWAAVAQCESSGRWHINVGLFDGGLQFLPSTWWGFGGGQYAQYAYMATRRQQIDIAERVLAVQGPNAWPNCFQALPVDWDE